MAPRFSWNGPLASPGPAQQHQQQQTWPKKWNPLQIRPWFVVLLASLFVALAVGIEIAYFFSVRNKGFDASDPWSLSGTQFLKSFLSSLLITPLVYLLGKQDEVIKILQPYVDLAEGSATAERSLLLDYITANSLRSIIRGAKNKHGVIVVSAGACVIAMLLQPLAGSLFTIRPTEVTLPTNTVIALTQLGLDPDLIQLDAFVAAAGFAEAAAFHNLSDPPFVSGTWAVTEFEIPDNNAKGNNGSATVTTVGIRSDPHCEAPTSQTLSPPGDDGQYTLAFTFPTCQGSVKIDPSSGDDSGVEACVAQQDSRDAAFAPAVFWYFIASPANATVVMCTPQVGIFNVEASVNATTNVLYDVKVIDDYPSSNNVSTFLKKGVPNWINFGTGLNALQQSRAVATQFQLPSAALRIAKLQIGGLEAVQKQFSGFLDITTGIYQQYLAIVAKSIYFQHIRAPIAAELRIYEPRLWLDPLACHGLAVVLILTALMLVYANWRHHGTRNRIYLATPPGTIASAITLTSNSRWTTLIGPADDEASVVRKLRGLSFRLDPISHHIIVDGEPLGQPRTVLPANAPILDPRVSVYSNTLKGTPTPGTENKHFSFQSQQRPMSQVTPMPYGPPEQQGLLSPQQRVESYQDTAPWSPYAMPQPTAPAP